MESCSLKKIFLTSFVIFAYLSFTSNCLNPQYRSRANDLSSSDVPKLKQYASKITEKRNQEAKESSFTRNLQLWKKLSLNNENEMGALKKKDRTYQRKLRSDPLNEQDREAYSKRKAVSKDFLSELDSIINKTPLSSSNAPAALIDKSFSESDLEKLKKTESLKNGLKPSRTKKRMNFFKKKEAKIIDKELLYDIMKKAFDFIESEMLNYEGIYRKNGVSGKIIIFNTTEDVDNIIKNKYYSSIPSSVKATMVYHFPKAKITSTDLQSLTPVKLADKYYESLNDEDLKIVKLLMQHSKNIIENSDTNKMNLAALSTCMNVMLFNKEMDPNMAKKYGQAFLELYNKMADDV